MYVYMLTNKKNGVLYVGVTSNLSRRMYEHKNHLLQGFTQKYNVDKLIYVEMFAEELEALQREKQLKRFYRRQKVALIEKTNPEWRDLTEAFI